MKLKDGFILRKVGGQNVVVAIGKASLDFNGIIRLNDTGKFLWEQLISAMLDEYNIDRETAEAELSCAEGVFQASEVEKWRQAIKAL